MPIPGRFLWVARQWQRLVFQSLQTVEWSGWPAARIVDKLRSTAECATVVQGVTAATDSSQKLLALATPVCLRGNYRQQLVNGYAHLRKNHLILLCQDLGLDILATGDTLKARIKSWANYEAPAAEHDTDPSPVDGLPQPNQADAAANLPGGARRNDAETKPPQQHAVFQLHTREIRQLHNHLR